VKIIVVLTNKTKLLIVSFKEEILFKKIKYLLVSTNKTVLLMVSFKEEIHFKKNNIFIGFNE